MDRYGGFDALYPKPRTDRGQPRRLPPEVAAHLVELKANNPAWSVRRVIQKAREDGVDHPLAPSTVHRLLSREGLFDKKPPDGADRRRFAFKEAGELWMSDVMHGPKVRHGRSLLVRIVIGTKHIDTTNVQTRRLRGPDRGRPFFRRDFDRFRTTASMEIGTKCALLSRSPHRGDHLLAHG